MTTFGILPNGEWDPFFTDSASTMWSDGPADVLSLALVDAAEEFVDKHGRVPTRTEMEAGWRFAMGGFDKAARDVAPAGARATATTTTVCGKSRCLHETT